MSDQTLADLVLLLHFGVVLFVVLGLPVIVLGNLRGWSWVNRAWWRLAHLMAIGVVVAQAWLGQYCFLTNIESELRVSAGQAGYQGSFIQHWLQQLLYFNAPPWVFVVAYTVFGGLVAWACWRYPPRFRRGQRGVLRQP